MMCANPIRYPKWADHPVPCGQCMNCRVNKQRKWVARILLEDRYSDPDKETLFVTLTYQTQHLPIRECLDPLTGELQNLPELSKRDVQLFLKKYRQEISKQDRTIRYFAVGEYGTKTFRPHYHLLIFNGKPEDEPIINKCWGKGFTSVGIGDLKKRAAYTAQYTTKKMTKGNDPRLLGRVPEFMICSRRPGIGSRAIKTLAKASEYSIASTGDDDVVRQMRTDGQRLPLDDFLKNKIRRELDIGRTHELRGTKPVNVYSRLHPSRTIMGQNAIKHAQKLERQKKHGTL